MYGYCGVTKAKHFSLLGF